MRRALAVVTATELRRDLLRTPAEPDLLREAGELAEGVVGELVVAMVMSGDEYEETLQRVLGVEPPDTLETEESEGIRDLAQSVADQVVAEKLGSVDVETDAIGLVADGDEADRILAVAGDRECDHVFVTGRGRSPTGKAIFGDVAQAVILGFDGPVTVVTG